MKNGGPMLKILVTEILRRRRENDKIYMFF